MKTKTFLASLALAGLVVAQPVSAAAASQDAVERIGSPVGESENLRAKPALIIALIALIMAGLIVLLSDGDESVSP